MKSQILSFLSGCLLLTACSSEMSELTDVEPQDNSTPKTMPMKLIGGIQGFDDENGTRAATVTSDWQEGDSLYIQFTVGTRVIDGLAVYMDSQWSVTPGAVISEGTKGSCKVYRFKKIAGKPSNAVTLSYLSAIYADLGGTFMVESGETTITAQLKPLTGRMRFKGSSGQTVTFYGLKWYTNYAVKGGLAGLHTGAITLKVAADGYTPYVYGGFEDTENRQLTVDLDDTYDGMKKCDEKVLAVGHSGYFNIPTRDSHSGWSMLDGNGTQQTIVIPGKSVSFKMVKVKPGTFRMGHSGGEDYISNAHDVTLTKAYYIGEFVVTNELYIAVMGSTPSDKNTGNDYPVEMVSWEMITQSGGFLDKLNALTGKTFRLPTEAEWEFAARGGNKGVSHDYLYAGSDDIDEVAWFRENSGSTTHPVGKKEPNELGLYDMTGNVNEWCQDWYDDYSSSAQTDPTGPTSGSNRVKRGGYWSAYPSWCRTVYRSSSEPSSATWASGFRLAL